MDGYEEINNIIPSVYCITVINITVINIITTNQESESKLYLKSKYVKKI